MSATKKLCIVKDNHELLKIIPIRDKNSTGFEIVVRASIEVRFFPINYENIAHIGLINSPDEELAFTYHTAGNGLKTNLHFKTNSTPGRKYWDVPFHSLAEPSEKQIIPIPLCKIVCNDSSVFPKHHNKSKNEKRILGENIEHNMDSHNVAEIYIMQPHSKSSFDELFDIWDLFFLTFCIMPMEYLSIPTPENISFKAKSMGNGRNIISSTIDQFNENISFIVCTYYSKESIESSKNYFSLFENGNYIEHFSATRMCFEDEFGVQSAIKPLYQWQLEKSKAKLTHSDYIAWQKFFNQAENIFAPKLRGIIAQKL